MTRPWLYNGMFSAGLAATGYAFALSGGSLAALMPFQAGILVVAGLGIVVQGGGRLSVTNMMRWAFISIILLLTVLVNIRHYSAASARLAGMHLVGIVGILFALQWAATDLVPEILLRQLAVLLLPLIALGIGVSLLSGGWMVRATPLGVQPNWWGELGFAFTLSTLAIPGWRKKSLLMGAALILFFLVQSRGALAAAGVSVALYTILNGNWSVVGRHRLLLSLALAACAVLVVALYPTWPIHAWAFFRDDVLRLYDPYRGIRTGMAGRLAGWRDAVSIYAHYPLLGQGLDTLKYVHNGFLQLAGEGGLTLLLGVLVMMGVALYEALMRRNYLSVSIIMGYAVYAMTYPRMLNMNLASVVFYLCLFRWPTISSHVTANGRPLDSWDTLEEAGTVGAARTT